MRSVNREAPHLKYKSKYQNVCFPLRLNHFPLIPLQILQRNVTIRQFHINLTLLS